MPQTDRRLSARRCRLHAGAIPRWVKLLEEEVHSGGGPNHSSSQRFQQLHGGTINARQMKLARSKAYRTGIFERVREYLRIPVRAARAPEKFSDLRCFQRL